jgi:hypothetical protein
MKKLKTILCLVAIWATILSAFGAQNLMNFDYGKVKSDGSANVSLFGGGTLSLFDASNQKGIYLNGPSATATIGANNKDGILEVKGADGSNFLDVRRNGGNTSVDITMGGALGNGKLFLQNYGSGSPYNIITLDGETGGISGNSLGLASGITSGGAGADGWLTVYNSADGVVFSASASSGQAVVGDIGNIESSSYFSPESARLVVSAYSTPGIYSESDAGIAVWGLSKEGMAAKFSQRNWALGAGAGLPPTVRIFSGNGEDSDATSPMLHIQNAGGSYRDFINCGGSGGAFRVTPEGAVVLPNMSRLMRDNIASPAMGMMIYQTDDTPGLRVYNGANWVKFTQTIDP